MTAKEISKVVNILSEKITPLLIKENTEIVEMIKRYTKEIRNLNSRVTRMEKRLAMDAKCPTCGRKHAQS